MRLIVDANVVFAGLLRDSLMLDPLVQLFAPEHLVTEVEKQLKSATRYRRRLQAGEPHISSVLSSLFAVIQTVPRARYQAYFAKALALAPHPEDAEYIALALHLKIPIWSNDAGMKEQDEVQVVTTAELVNL